MKHPTLSDLIAARLLARQGIAAIWSLYVRAARAHRVGNWLSARSLISTAEAAERRVMNRQRPS